MKYFKIKYSTLVILFFLHFSTSAQEILDCLHLDSTATFEQRMECLFGNMNRSSSRIPSRFLLEQGYNYIRVDKLQGQILDSNLVNIDEWLLTYHSLRSSYLGGLNLADTLGLTLPSNKISLPSVTILERWIQGTRGIPNGYKPPQGAPLIKLPILLIKYHSLREDALNQGWVSIQDNQIYDTPSGLQNSPFEAKNAFAVAPSQNKIEGNSAVFFFTPWMFVSNISSNQVSSLEVDFDNGMGYQVMQWNSPIYITWANGTKKELKYKIRLMDNTILQGHSMVQINTASTSANRYENSADWTVDLPAVLNSHAGATLQISFSDSNKDSRQITRPFIIFEGFDPENNYGYVDFLGEINNAIFLNNSLSFNANLSGANRGNYDLIFVNYKDGSDDIRRNARLCQDVIRWVNAQKSVSGSNEQNIVMGMSMGGLVARYGLAQMVRANENTQVRLLITHDTPHRGANVPLGFQHLVRGISKIYPLRILVKDLHLAAKAIRSTAAKQMLVYRVDMDYPSPLPIPGATTVDKNTWLDSDYRPMVNLPTPYKVIATSQGSDCGETIIQPGQELLHLDASALAGFGFGLIKSGLNMETYVWAGSADGSRNQVLDLLLFSEVRLFFGAVRLRIPFAGAWAKNEQGSLAYDAMPGGTYPILDAPTGTNALLGWGQILTGTLNFYMQYTNTRTAPAFSFVSTASALDVEEYNNTTGFARYFNGINSNVQRINGFMSQVQDFSTNSTFSVKNIEHITFTARQSEWMFNEMQNVANNNVNCATTCPSNITGFYTSITYPTCSTATVTMATPTLQPVRWVASGNLFPTSGNGNVANIQSGLSGMGWVDFFIGNDCNAVRVRQNVKNLGQVTYGNFSITEQLYGGTCPFALYTIVDEGGSSGVDRYYWEVEKTDVVSGEITYSTIENKTIQLSGYMTARAYAHGGCSNPRLIGTKSWSYACSESERTVSPNPAANSFILDKNNTEADVILYNKYNQVVYQGKTYPNQPLTINTSGLANDVYYLHIIEANGLRTQRQVIISK